MVLTTFLLNYHKNRIKVRFIIASLKSSIKPLASTNFRLCKCHVWVVQNNKPVTDAMNGLNKRRKAASVSTFDFSTLYTKLPHNKLLIVLNSLIDFCFDGGKNKYIAVNNYGTR